ncbi:MAG: ankyrin repeat domain-containing protein [Synergistaceae bacterium]|jgi:hypothetical protein|nr:ankyrin repeat domain-containing protein [Synergistaceae bacterium]
MVSLRRLVLAGVCVVFLGTVAYGAYDNEAFLKLCAGGTPEEVRAAIEAGADVKAKDKDDGWTALMYAARYSSNPTSHAARGLLLYHLHGIHFPYTPVPQRLLPRFVFGQINASMQVAGGAILLKMLAIPTSAASPEKAGA